MGFLKGAIVAYTGIQRCSIALIRPRIYADGTCGVAMIGIFIGSRTIGIDIIRCIYTLAVIERIIQCSVAFGIQSRSYYIQVYADSGFQVQDMIIRFVGSRSIGHHQEGIVSDTVISYP